MIINEFFEGQGLGNQLWCYISTLGIANKLGVEQININCEKFKGKDFLEINNCYNYNGNYKIYYERLYYDDRIKYIASSYDPGVLLIKGDTKIIGILQSEKYFYEYKDIINDNIKIKNENKIFAIDNDVCILNIRGGEYKKHKDFILPKSYWLNAMRNIQKYCDIKKFMIVTDDVKYAKYLFPNIKDIITGIEETFYALYSAKNIIVSNSTFSYFPIKMSSKFKNIIAPMLWARFKNKECIWASPCNYYDEWHWQDSYGNIIENEICKNIISNTEAIYKEKFYILARPEAITNYRMKNNKILIFIKNIIKKILRIISPRYF